MRCCFKEKRLSWLESVFLFFLLLLDLCICVHGVCVWAHVPWCLCGNQRAMFVESILFFHLYRVLRIEVKLPGLCAISAAWKLYILFIHHWKYLLLLCVDVGAHTIVWSEYDVCRIGSLTLCGFWWLNLRCQVCMQVPLPTRPPRQAWS